MYSDSISHRKTMGDVDVLWHDGLYHLFHLVLPNHDFVAHAISEDGLNWERIENALFIGHPGSWDDHMLWTMHVTEDPHRPGSWRMFYTGLARKDRADVQRIGLARSTDLRRWFKVADCWRSVSGPRDTGMEGVSSRFDPESDFPLAAAAPYYESSVDEGRHWVSFRDPFYYREEDRGYLLMTARTPNGPLIRRGCVGIAEEIAPDKFRLLPPLHHPGLYDDIEVPNLLKLGGRYYLVGSIREDAKIRYWHADDCAGPWRNFFDNVLLPAGNYAARIGLDERGPLVWNFFTSEVLDRTIDNLMPPPKRLQVDDTGLLRVTTFERFDGLRKSRLSVRDLLPVETLRANPFAESVFDSSTGDLRLRSEGGVEAFLFRGDVDCFRFHATIHLDGLGKCGFVFRFDPETASGYHLSLDLIKGLAQLRDWGEQDGGTKEHVFRFRPLQAAYWRSDVSRSSRVTLLAVGNYLEFSLDGRVLLTLADPTYSQGRLGCYVESACLRIGEIDLEHLLSPQQPIGELPKG